MNNNINLENLSMFMKYEKLKAIYKDYVILIKSGNFWVSLYKDGIICKYLFNYTYLNNRVSFPNKSLNKNLSKLFSLKINYLLVINNNNIKAYEFNNNSYAFYFDKYYNKYLYDNKLSKLINKINKDNITIIENILK